MCRFHHFLLARLRTVSFASENNISLVCRCGTFVSSAGVLILVFKRGVVEEVTVVVTRGGSTAVTTFTGFGDFFCLSILSSRLTIPFSFSISFLFHLPSFFGFRTTSVGSTNDMISIWGIRATICTYPFAFDALSAVWSLLSILSISASSSSAFFFLFFPFVTVKVSSLSH